MAGILTGLALLFAGSFLMVRALRERLAQQDDDQPDSHAVWSNAHLPTLTTEMTGNVVRDPDFELDANKVRGRQGF